MSGDGRTVDENLEDYRRLVDEELAATMRTWVSQQRLRQRILSRVRDLTAHIPDAELRRELPDPPAADSDQRRTASPVGSK